MRHAARRDGTERVIVDALRAAGAVVRRLNEKDLPDLLVAFRGRWFCLECKSERGRERPGQRLFRLVVGTVGVDVHVVRSAEEALAALRIELEATP